MRVKSYFAATVEAAMNAARLELGSDAMLVSTKRTSEERRHLGEYEVVFAAARHPENALAVGGVPNAAALNHGAPHYSTATPIDKLSEEVAALKHELERLASAMSRSSAGIAKIGASADLAAAFSMLLDADLDTDVAQEVLSRVCGRLEKPDRTASCARVMALELQRMVNADSRLAGDTGRNAIALVGPPGAGKTTTLVKLAVQYGVAARRSTQIFSLDTHRVAATEPLRSYAAIAGLPFRALPTVRSLWQALEESRAKELIFIDTPGLSGAEFEDAADLARSIARHPTIEVHLVLNAAVKASDLRRTARQYEMFAPAKLIFTHLDETETFGSLLNIAIRTDKPISFLARGQQIPEDLEPASSHKIVELVIKDTQSSLSEMSSTAAA